MSQLAASLARNGPLFRNLLRREVRQRYKGSALGLAWTLITPAIMVGAYSLVFHYVWKVINIPHYALFLFTGLTVWTFFLGGTQAAASSLVANANLVKKVRFPREIVPLSTLAGQAFTAGTMLVIAIPLCVALTAGSRLTLLALPPLILLLAALTAGFGLLLSALNVYFRDVEHILAALALPWFFLTPIFYTFASLPALQGDNEWVVDVLRYGNFITPFVESIQDSLFFGVWPSGTEVIYCVVAACVMLALGLGVFRRLEREMAVEL
jgi:homopolymeric O-antigen transport system permease protein